MKIHRKFPDLPNQANKLKDEIKLKRLSISLSNALAKDAKPVFVYQMGKVGSTSIYESVRSAGMDVFHAHVLTYPKEKQIPKGFEFQIKSGWLLNEKLIGSGVPMKLITLTRDPVARNISAYFHNLESICRRSDQAETRKLLSVFLQKYQHHIPLSWFDDELKAVTGIDCYQHEFNKKEGFGTISLNNIELLVMNVELDNAEKERVLGEFLGLPRFRLLERNVASEKNYAAQYADFQKLIQLPDTYLNDMLDSKYCRHFYDDESIAGFYRKWTNQAKILAHSN